MAGFAGILGMLLILSGCMAGEDNSSQVNLFYNSMNPSTEAATETVEADTQGFDESSEEELYLIVSIDSAAQTMRVYRYQNQMEYQYYYGLSTEFCNKYGKHTAVANFGPGDAIYISDTDKYGRVIRIQKADAVWVYDDVKRFSTDTEQGILKIGDTKYRVGADTFIFSGEEQIGLEELTENDILSVVGIKKRILSVSVMTGHGTLVLKNTKLFEGSFLQLNRNIFTEITPGMSMDVQEGAYTLAVANNGWGGSTDITIERGKKTVVDLDTIKGEGPKMGKVRFELDTQDARIFVDKEEVEASKAVKLSYGAHKLVVMSEKYDTVSKTLYVNSDEATVLISLTDDTNTTAAQAQAAEPPDRDSSQGSQTTSDSGTGTAASTNSISNEDLSDYLSTISSLLSTISS